MRIIEYRIIVPLSIEQCRLGCQYMCAKYQAELSKEGQGYEVFENRTEADGSQFTHKALHFINKAPAALRWALPAKWCVVQEESIDNFPHYVTRYYSKEIARETAGDVTETTHMPYTHGMTIPENTFGLNNSELKKREVLYLDVLNGPKSEDDLDLHHFSFADGGVSEMTANHSGNENAIPEWVATYPGPMTLIVKVAKMHFNMWGLQKLAETYCMNNFYTPAYRDMHRYMIKHINEWHNMKDEDVRAVEQRCQQGLKNATFHEDWTDQR